MPCKAISSEGTLQAAQRGLERRLGTRSHNDTVVRSAMARILIIDDDEAVRRTAQIVLEANGFDAVVVADGKSGIDAIKELHVDAVIVDLFMPGMDGLETTKAIRELSPQLPIIAASGFMFGGSCPEMPHFQEIAQEAGAISTLYKPFRAKDLLQAIEKAIGVAA
jgi:CheY-like chemotaxis protein